MHSSDSTLGTCSFQNWNRKSESYFEKSKCHVDIMICELSLLHVLAGFVHFYII